MILLRMMGGLGNQMFQYAFAYSIACKNNIDFKVDDTLLNDRSLPNETVTYRELVLNNVFNLDVKLADKKEIEYFNGKKYSHVLGKIYNMLLWQFIKHRLVIEKSRAFDSNLLKIEDNVCFVGSFQSELYFKTNEEAIRKLYTFRANILPVSLDLCNLIQSNESVAIHVRRGDYVSSSLYSDVIGALSLEYYDKAIYLMRTKFPNSVFYIFSDDINWCKENFKKYNLPFIFVGDEHAGINAANYLQLISMCKHFIISNSTFAWWGAWLSKSATKTVIAPAKWFKKAGYNNNNIVPENWIKI